MSHLQAEQISTFKKNLEVDAVKEAVEQLSKSTSKVVKCEGLRIVVSKRDNDTIKSCLEAVRLNYNQDAKKAERQSQGHYLQEEDHDCRESAFSAVVLFATLNDDPDTLECLVDWWRERDCLTKGEKNHCNHAIIFACLVNYTRCIKPLYQMNYRIPIHEEDKRCILQILFGCKAMENELQFYCYLNYGCNSCCTCTKDQQVEEIVIRENSNGSSNHASQSNHVSICMEEMEEEVGKGVKLRKQSTWIQQRCREEITSLQLYNRLEKKDVFEGEHDTIESFLHLKASSNPVYLVVEYQDAIERSKLEEGGMNAEDLRWKDPLRKALAISRYTLLRSNHDRQYLKETFEISQVPLI